MTVAGARILVVMGVTATGKSTLARALAARIGWRFQEGDDLHSRDAVAKMRAGHPLTDADRAPWLHRVRAWIDARVAAGEPAIVSCSALKRAYREVLCGGLTSVAFVALEGDEEVLQARLRDRRGHFMPATLLASQLASYEPPAADERAVRVPAGIPLDVQITLVLEALAGRSR